jgi:hypothetical protein
MQAPASSITAAIGGLLGRVGSDTRGPASRSMRRLPSAHANRRASLRLSMHYPADSDEFVTAVDVVEHFADPGSVIASLPGRQAGGALSSPLNADNGHGGSPARWWYLLYPSTWRLFRSTGSRLAAEDCKVRVWPKPSGFGISAWRRFATFVRHA